MKNVAIKLMLLVVAYSGFLATAQTSVTPKKVEFTLTELEQTKLDKLKTQQQLLNTQIQLAQAQVQLLTGELQTSINTFVAETSKAHGDPKDITFDAKTMSFVPVTKQEDKAESVKPKTDQKK